LSWPVTRCEACDYDLREARPKASERANDEHGKLVWNDFCPQCGHGYMVGYRLVPAKPAEVLAQEEIEKVVKQPQKIETFESIDPEHQIVAGEVPAGKPSGQSPEERGRELAKKTEDSTQVGSGESGVIDPEGQLGQQEEETTQEEPPGPGEPHTPMENQYWCTKCAGLHFKDSGKGKKHAEFSE